MFDIIEPVTVADIRAYLSMNLQDSAEDSLLMGFASTARERAEQYINRAIAPREIVREIGTPNSGTIYLPDKVRVLIRVDYELGADNSDITSYCKASAGGRVTLPPMTRGTFFIRYVPEEYAPETVRTAILMMVRNLYADRAADPLTADVKNMLKPHRSVLV